MELELTPAYFVRLRQAAGLAQCKAAHACGVSPAWVWMLESGRWRTSPTAQRNRENYRRKLLEYAASKGIVVVGA